MPIALILILFGGLTDAVGQNEQRSTLIRYAKVHVGNGDVIDNAYVVFQGNEISQVSDANKTRIDPTEYDTIIEADGLQMYPGFILMDSRVGLTEIDQVRATHDFKETGKFIPNVRALPAFNSESEIIKTVRSNGVLTVQAAPTGAIVSGTSSLMNLAGDNWRESVLKSDDGVFLQWPSRITKTGWWAEPGESKLNKKYDEVVQEITQFFEEALADQSLPSHVHQNLRFEATSGLFEGSQRLYVRVNYAKDILDVVQFFRESGIKQMAIVGGAEADLVVNELKENNIPVVIDRVHKLPIHSDDPVDKPYKLASMLHEAGIKVAFATAGDMEAMISRNLPFQVGTAVHYGLPYEQGIKALTLSAAEILGADDMVGSIEPGKRATFFLCSGDPLDIRTNHVESSFINGEQIELTNRQSGLAEKFMKKHGIN